MTLAPPTMVSDWVADSGASYHTTSDAGILSSTSPPPLPSFFHRCGKWLCPTRHLRRYRGSSWSLPFNQRPCRPNIMQNLLSVRQFTTDNSCSMEFDPFGLSVKDLATKTLLARCDSPGPLYTLRLPASSTPTSAPPVLATAASSVLCDLASLSRPPRA